MLVTRSPVRRSIKKSPISNNQALEPGNNNLSYPINYDNSGISGISKDNSFSPDPDRKFKQIRNVETGDDVKNFAS